MSAPLEYPAIPAWSRDWSASSAFDAPTEEFPVITLPSSHQGKVLDLFWIVLWIVLAVGSFALAVGLATGAA